MRRIGLFVAFACSAFSVANPAAVNREVQRYMTFFMSPGVSVAVVRDGKIVFSKGYGIADLESQKPVTESTQFKIGSVSKPILAIAVMLLKQDGKLALDDPVSKFIDGTPATWQKITIRHLLQHTAGLDREAPGWKPFEIVPLSDVIKSAFDQPMIAEPGVKYQYSNVGYFTIAAIIEKVTGMSFGDFVKKRIFQPLGMTHSGITDYFAVMPDRAKPYAWTDGLPTHDLDYLSVRPSGAFLSTASDLARLQIGLMSPQFLSDASRREMFTSGKTNDGNLTDYGLGWILASRRGQKTIGHDGALPGFRAAFQMYPDLKLGIFVLNNVNASNPNGLVDKLAGIYAPELREPEAKPHADPDLERTNRVGDYFRLRAQGQSDRHLLTQEFGSQPASLNAKRRITGFGKLRKVTRLDTASIPPGFTHIYRLEFERLTLQAVAKFEGNLISSIGLMY